MDGLDMWDALSEDKKSPRNLMLHNIDDTRHIASVRVGDWKFSQGTQRQLNKNYVLYLTFPKLAGTTYKGAWDGYYGPSGRGGPTPDYNLDQVLNSPAAKALKAIGVGLPNNATVKDNNFLLRDFWCAKLNSRSSHFGAKVR